MCREAREFSLRENGCEYMRQVLGLSINEIREVTTPCSTGSNAAVKIRRCPNTRRREEFSREGYHPHAHIGQVAVALYDSQLLHEAKSFLRFFKLESWEHRLNSIADTRRYDCDFLVEDAALSAP